MKNWFLPHKILLCILGAFVITQVAFLFLAYLPREERLEELRGEREALREKLKRSPWPMEAVKLQSELEKRRAEMLGEGALEAKSKAVFRRALSTFRDNIETNYGSVAEFMKGVSRLDYQSEYSRIAIALAEKGIQLDSTALGLAEDTPTVYTYQLLMQIWTVEKLALLAREHALELTWQRARHARIKVLPMRTYVTSGKTAQPYLIEFPVSLTVDGNLASCLHFVEALQKPPLFLPVRAFEVFSLPPTEGDAKDGNTGPCRLLMSLECVSYLIP